MSADGEWQRREYVMRNAARTATLLIAESDVGRGFAQGLRTLRPNDRASEGSAVSARFDG